MRADLIERLRSRAYASEQECRVDDADVMTEAADALASQEPVEPLYILSASLRKNIPNGHLSSMMLGWRRGFTEDAAKGSFLSTIQQDKPGFSVVELLCTQVHASPVVPVAAEDPRWQKLRDLFGLDGWFDGIWQGMPTPDQIVTHIEYVARERARLLFEPVAAKAEAEGWRPTHRHLKSGHLVRVLGVGKMQSGKWIDPIPPHGLGHPRVDMADVVIYEHGGALWARPREEFEDGRFEPLPTGKGDGQP